MGAIYRHAAHRRRANSVAVDAANLMDSSILSQPKVILRMPYLEYNLQLEPLHKWRCR